MAPRIRPSPRRGKSAWATFYAGDRLIRLDHLEQRRFRAGGQCAWEAGYQRTLSQAGEDSRTFPDIVELRFPVAGSRCHQPE